MQLLKFIEKQTAESYHQMLLIATVSGLANSLLLVISNHATDAVIQGEDLTQYFILYMVTFALFLYGQWYAFDRAISLIEDAIFQTRTRLTQKVQKVELSFIEKIGTNNLYGRLTQNDTLISQATPQIVGAFQMFTLMVFSFLYLGYLSPITFIITMAALGLGGIYFLFHSRFIKKSLNEVREKEKIYFQSISHLVSGFKEVKMNPDKGNDLLQHIARVSNEAQNIKSEVRKPESRLWGFGRLFIYALLPIVIFIVPSFVEEHAKDIAKISSTLLFLIGPTTILVNMIPILSRVNISIDDLFTLEKEMDEAIAASENIIVNTVPFSDFQRIKFDNVSFSYPGSDQSFFSGPFNKEINAGELLFVIGGNGSGKSTFLKLLTGLYYPSEGGLYVDDKLVDSSCYIAYRNLFSIIFTDFHLFNKFYGISDPEEEKIDKVNFWLEKMRMQHKVSYKDGGFTSTSLSTGQRKRLAFIAAMLENKPILVVDEFAADQDPQFREYFYETLLGEIKSTGKTIIAVTHDDHYFYVADRVWKMDEGKIVPYNG
jgi:putative ATP-binding cassette transporter